MLTNDDGYEAEGLAVLWEAATSIWGDRVRVAAPRVGHSQKSHATKTGPKNPIEVGTLHGDPMRGVVVDGYPADCVRIALKGLDLFDGKRPLVLSGVNQGGNAGVDIFYSGTLAAAREAAFFGCPAVALSQLKYRDVPVDWRRTRQWTEMVLRRLENLLEADNPVLWNVNFPAPSGSMPPLRVVPMSTDPLAVSFERSDGPDDSTYSYNGPYFDRPAAQGTDVAELFGGSITLTPLGLDLTLRDYLDRFPIQQGNGRPPRA